MKALFTFLILVALGVVWMDDHSKRTSLDEAQQQLDTQSQNIASMTQQIRTLSASQSEGGANMARQIQTLSAERDQLKIEVARLSNTPVAGQNWLQQRVNQSTGLLDPRTRTH